jgi:outer membrane protein assembly factor BamE (lipoprotein component of BamABCDE complex)
LTSDNLNKIKTGMSKEEVKVILGEPSQIEQGETLGISGTTFYYKAGKTEAKVVFLNNGVMAKEGSF